MDAIRGQVLLLIRIGSLQLKRGWLIATLSLSGIDSAINSYSCTQQTFKASVTVQQTLGGCPLPLAGRGRRIRSRPDFLLTFDIARHPVIAPRSYYC